MMRVQLTEVEKSKLRKKAKKELERLEMYDAEQIQLLDVFKHKFNLCETAYKVLLKKYLELTNQKKSGRLSIKINQVRAALNMAGYAFDEENLTELFGSESKKNPKQRTVKKLRDAVTHGIEKKAVHEITERRDELFGYMDDFLTMIRTFDDNAA